MTTPSSVTLAAITQTGTKPPPPRILIHGPEKIGKSTFGSLAPSPIFIQTEDGLNGIRTSAFPLATSYDDVMAAFEQLYTQPHDFKTCVLDSADWLERLVWQKTCDVGDGNGAKKNIEDFGYGKGYGLALDYWKQILMCVNGLRDQRGMATIIIAHSAIKRFDAPDKAASYDRYQPKLHASAGALLKEAFDIIGFANVEATIVQTDVGFNQKKAKAVGGGRRVLNFAPNPAWVAGSRFRLPDTIDLSWDAFAAAYGQAIAPPAPAA